MSPQETQSTRIWMLRKTDASDPHSSFQLAEHPATKDGKPLPATTAPKAALPADPSDPTGLKAYIANSIAHQLYPKGAGIDPDQDISDDVALNAGTIASEINVYGNESATVHHLTWTLVTATQVGKLGTVSDLVKLVKSSLSDPATGASK